ncbi:secondary thiamine-phosphate synthase enzyme YjbQ [Deinococcus yavapaiensis]|uniref:Secondary thiamine-phosphate synthase enzyme n=1 Tax=Deinococcus yavapaiensis KR-236 TaxID=694435 RepID=A0A318S638_9DEIO|nr:secondary thiamine-phosphate synthase enzyme YjbQ [Deinococcus yavapaiensis]PYE51864.1 secondary thiamine-phosphate synthase enzyme [Deinococcus yavapaiensis KR-236]
MPWFQTTLTLPAKSRGVHLVTRDVLAALPELSTVRVGLLHVFLRHTSASLALNENASPDVRRDLERFLTRLVPDGTSSFEHQLEGPDDMPAHVKAVLIGDSLTLPITNGRLGLGTWQGLYLCEHRDDGGPRTLVLTAHGETS